MEQYYAAFGLFCTIIGAALWHERRITKIEVLLTNHLAHHEGFEGKLTTLLGVLVKTEAKKE